MGDSSTASGETSTAIGAGTLASGKISTAIGNFTTASDYASLVIGQYNASGSTANDATQFSEDNTAFVIGNGTDSFEGASDAFKVMFNGDATLTRDLTVKGDIVVSSDARLKSNIVSLGSTLSRLLLIDGKSYTMLKDGKQKIGLLAQEIKEVFPELVSEDDNEMLAVNYQGLVPVLINALKEQDEKMNEQNDKISRLENLVEKLISDK
jgi:autotransporter adhesin